VKFKAQTFLLLKHVKSYVRFNYSGQ